MSRPDRLPKVLTSEETKRLLNQPNQRYFGPHRDYLYIHLLMKAGLRASEAVSLKPEHVDLMSGKLMSREGKGAKDRTLWLGEEVLEELREWTGRRPESNWLLPTRKGTRVAPSHLRRSVKRYARKAKLEEVERVSPHTLRYIFATRLYRDTSQIRIVQKALGHWDLSTTMVYTHVVDEELEDGAKQSAGGFAEEIMGVAAGLRCKRSAERRFVSRGKGTGRSDGISTTIAGLFEGESRPDRHRPPVENSAGFSPRVWPLARKFLPVLRPQAFLPTGKQDRGRIGPLFPSEYLLPSARNELGFETIDTCHYGVLWYSYRALTAWSN